MIRNNSRINNWEISAQITHAPQQHHSHPTQPHPHPPATSISLSPYFKRVHCVENKQQYTTSCPHPIDAGQKTTFPSVLTPTLTVKEAGAADGGSELKSSLRKSKRVVGQEPVGNFSLFFSGFLTPKSLSPVPESRLASPRKLPAIL